MEPLCALATAPSLGKTAVGSYAHTTGRDLPGKKLAITIDSFDAPAKTQQSWKPNLIVTFNFEVELGLVGETQPDTEN
jgi:hypothetical protein